MTTARFRVTYATLTSDNEELHAAYENGLRTAKSWLGAEFAGNGPAFTVTSPCDRSVVLCTAHAATESDVDAAVAAAAGSDWAAKPWPERVSLLRRAADLISERSGELSALMSMEVGKNRLEALGDVEESADLIRYYCRQFEDNNGFSRDMERLSEVEHTRSVLRPHGVWAVISPFNFPMALAAGPAGAALVAGNTVVLKPSEQGTFTAVKLVECLRDAGIPADALHLLLGGDEVGRAVVAHPRVAGLTFTGSYQAGMAVYQGFSTRYPKPAICEMGGKNAAVVTASADLDVAAAGIARSAFGFSGQKCSACSRVYVAREAYQGLLDRLVVKAGETVVGDPTQRSVFMGPVIDEAAVGRFEAAVEHARAVGRVAAGGEVLRRSEGRADGHYVTPTVVTDLPADDRLLRDELFVPLVAVVPVDSLDEAITLANDTDFGLTAGVFAGERAEIDTFLDRVEAGVVYVNRAAGATTGAWPGVQPFGGWKGSGSTGKAGGGLYYVQQYLREQSRTEVAQ
ncbi:aldehyde dehydrogenase family protein [Kutzneria sp. CA-103260]|uniref:aldehyde dehydrogenase family protein n=1 Tax=Kutzneria sp. CA-103260 TaxID=2802641 RepID=UPI001BA99B0B|nr:aldehyde dehydrogenase family protein [Kutzneria sp. CA-103260]QUQ63503.1 aldehyde dehydrogenase [Kutzneria sp. CA-103260]